MNVYFAYLHERDSEWLQCRSYLADSFHFRVHLWQYFHLMKEMKQGWRGLVCRMKLLIASLHFFLSFFLFFLSESETPLSYRNFFRNIRTSKNSTSVNQRIFPICKKRCELARISVLSLDGVSGPTTHRSRTPCWHGAWRKPNRHFKNRETLSEFWSLRRREYPEIADHTVQQLLYFVSAYPSETALSEQAFTANNQRSRLDP